MTIDKMGYATIDPTIMEWIIFSMWIHACKDYIKWNQEPISARKIIDHSSCKERPVRAQPLPGGNVGGGYTEPEGTNSNNRDLCWEERQLVY